MGRRGHTDTHTHARTRTHAPFDDELPTTTTTTTTLWRWKDGKGVTTGPVKRTKLFEDDGERNWRQTGGARDEVFWRAYQLVSPSPPSPWWAAAAAAA
ncbi:hypothetical protein L249_4009 [Ophiocordyceps polyrhachis-furcata BCC 54312]|uniref:GYF domain-containing protein n=1 Tax=Ophiocordyceps polyrhachis-furcata BCC 54312 TaxID=1330021 RepID=A0A367L5A9_9HYPO|nr:hypothetical protein L249_4009 [Ophiocordyceps polyrhachis-furcata BCC 54312]